MHYKDAVKSISLKFEIKNLENYNYAFLLLAASKRRYEPITQLALYWVDLYLIIKHAENYNGQQDYFEHHASYHWSFSYQYIIDVACKLVTIISRTAGKTGLKQQKKKNVPILSS